MTKKEKLLYKRLQTAESFIAGYNAWDDYMQYLIKIDSTYSEPTTADEYNNSSYLYEHDQINETVDGDK
jgi:hypothetical protein|tara:strand:- start:864 stop:1070 length:207 start_codon:yes stop_codon:yes gene_type:complete